MEERTCLVANILTSPSESPLLHLPVVHLNARKLFLCIFFLSSAILLQRPLAAEMASFHYLDFKNPTGICFQGNATAKGTGAIQQTTRDVDGSVGLAYCCEPIHLWDPTTNQLANFTTTFIFGVGSIVGTTRGGGVTFFLSEDPTIPQGGRGDYLGLENGQNGAVPTSSRFVAVEFDSRPNHWDPLDSPCHMGIDINSLESVVVAKMWDDIFIPGTQGKAHVSYNSMSKNLIVSLDYNQTLYRLSYSVDLKSHLPQHVYVGFSLATDNSQDPKIITSWSFQYSNLDAYRKPSPPPSATPVKPNNSSNSNEGTTSKKKIGILVAGIVVPLLIILVTVILYFVLCKSKSKKEDNDVVGEMPLRLEDVHIAEDGCPRHIPFKQLVAATHNFHQRQRLGREGTGRVYRGFLKDLNQEVAIKRIESYSGRGEKEFAAEVKTISQLRHRNLVKLIGSCREGHNLLLVYDFMPNGSLDDHLFDNGDKVLSWPRRYNIAIGLASALQYLHEESEKCIVHRDIKPSNILLDSEFNAKLGDFGLARATKHGSDWQATLAAGTTGYMAPEYIHKGIASKEADVYSFGIVALELASGNRAIDTTGKRKGTLFHWIQDLYEKGVIMDAIDKNLGTTFDNSEATRLITVGLWCADLEARNRPSFRQVISALKFEIAPPSIITQPPNTPVSDKSSSAKYTDDWLNNNYCSTNNSPVGSSMGSSS